MKTVYVNELARVVYEPGLDVYSYFASFIKTG
jgi:hypothetical protein